MLLRLYLSAVSWVTLSESLSSAGEESRIPRVAGSVLASAAFTSCVVTAVVFGSR